MAMANMKIVIATNINDTALSKPVVMLVILRKELPVGLSCAFKVQII